MAWQQRTRAREIFDTSDMLAYQEMTDEELRDVLESKNIGEKARTYVRKLYDKRMEKNSSDKHAQPFIQQAENVLMRSGMPSWMFDYHMAAFKYQHEQKPDASKMMAIVNDALAAWEEYKRSGQEEDLDG